MGASRGKASAGELRHKSWRALRELEHLLHAVALRHELLEQRPSGTARRRAPRTAVAAAWMYGCRNTSDYCFGSVSFNVN